MVPQWRKPLLHVFILEKSLKIFFFRFSRLISIKLDTNHPCIKGRQICTNKWQGSLPRGENCKNEWGHLKIFRTNDLEKLRFT
jgi:hypothetical protein